MLQKAKVDLKPLLSSLSANKEKLKESCKCLLESPLCIEKVWISVLGQLVLTYCCFIKSQIASGFYLMYFKIFIKQYHLLEKLLVGGSWAFPPSPPPHLELDHYTPVNAVVLLGIRWQPLTPLPQSAMFLLRLCTLNIDLSFMPSS